MLTSHGTDRLPRMVFRYEIKAGLWWDGFVTHNRAGQGGSLIFLVLVP
jgi:hypothetical protein